MNKKYCKKSGFTAWQIKDLSAPAPTLRRNGGEERFRLCGFVLHKPALASHTNGRLAFTKCKALSSSFAFTLAEVLITLAVIGVVAAITVPSIAQSTQKKELAVALLKFNSSLSQAITMWKTETGCNSPAKYCIEATGILDNDISAFEKTFGKYMYIIDKTSGTNTKNWLPDYTLNYYGDQVSCSYGSVAHNCSQNYVYLLKDGTTLSMDYSPYFFDMTIDINGKRKPNRIGKDVFNFTVGTSTKKDITYAKYYATYSSHNAKGLTAQETDNTDPTQGTGANPTYYVMLHKQLPDYGVISQAVSGFKP